MKKTKVLILAVMLMCLAMSVSLTRQSIPEVEEGPGRAMLGYARNIVMLNGPNGEGQVYLERWPAYTPYLTGLVDDPAMCGPVAD